ncbi:MAG: ATP-binding protein [Bacteroidales bacterium]|nr:ATP-binding protein [Bacteroidales bacterium]
MRKTLWIKIILCSLLLVSTIGAVRFSLKNMEMTRPEKIHAVLQQRFLEKEADMLRHIGRLMELERPDIAELLRYCREKQISDTEFAFYIYEGDTLEAWSSNAVYLPSKLKKSTREISGYRQLDKNRIHVWQKTVGRRTVFGIYVMESPYLGKNTFCDLPPLKINSIRLQPVAENYDIRDASGKAVFSLDIGNRLQVSDTAAMLEALWWMLNFTLLIAIVFLLLRRNSFFRRHPEMLSLAIILLAAGSLELLLRGGLPLAMHTSNLFSSRYYSSFFGSLGGLFMGSCTLLMTAVIIVKRKTQWRLPDRTRPSLVIFTAAHALFAVAFICFHRMIRNASVSALPSLPMQGAYYLTENIFLLKFLFAFSLCAEICALLLIMERMYALFFRQEKAKWKKTAQCLISALIVWTVYLLVILKNPALESHRIWLTGGLVYLGIVGTNIVHSLLPKSRFSIRYLSISCMLSILLLSLLIEDTNEERLQTSRESFANSLLDNEDPLIRHKMLEINSQLDTDDSLHRLFADTSLRRNDILSYLQELYIEPNFENNRKSMFLGRSSIGSDRIRISEYANRFQAYIADTQCPSLRMTDRQRIGSSSYLLFKAFPSKSMEGRTDTVYLVLETVTGSDYFKPRYLLNRDEHRLENEMQRFSCAEYEDGRLTTYFDIYNLFLLDLKSYGQDTLYNGMHFKHRNTDYYAYFMQPSHVVLLAMRQGLIRNSITTFPYLLLLAMLISITAYILVNLKRQQRFLLFKQRIQLLIVSMIIMTAIIGSILFSMITLKFSQEELYQSSFARCDMIENMLPCADLDKDSSNVQYLNRQLLSSLYRIPKAYVENTNIYTLDGESVIALDKRLPIPQSPNRLNPKVIENIQYEKKTFYRDTGIARNLTQANILYKPLQNSKGEIVAYLSFPSRQKGGYLEHLFTSSLPTFLCIYMLLTILFAVFSSLIGNYLMASLTHIADMMGKVKLKSANSKIQWKYDDEIGMLVKDYNRLVDDLEVSAELLARSERESSWKELAQQVAHEIKNPLTPMKLRTQQMQRQLHEGRLTEEQLESYTRMMVGQIDALTDIASSFSSLAKMRQGKGSSENLLEIIESAAATYEGSGIIEITHAPEILRADVLTEKEQMLRVFNNLIKNAIQAKKENLPPLIEIHLDEADDNHWRITLTDYGKGMGEKEKRHAFTPHFTTKSSGSGLGLAIVKNIVSDWGGSIRFESVRNDHTSFFILLPKYKQA